MKGRDCEGTKFEGKEKENQICTDSKNKKVMQR